jgi:hypothetical protein
MSVIFCLQDKLKPLLLSPHTPTLIKRHTRIRPTTTFLQLPVLSYQNPSEHCRQNPNQQHEPSAYTHALNIIRPVLIWENTRPNQRSHLANDIQYSHPCTFLTVTFLIVQRPGDNDRDCGEETGCSCQYGGTKSAYAQNMNRYSGKDPR